MSCIHARTAVCRQCSIPHPPQDSWVQTVQCPAPIPGWPSIDNAVSHICPRTAECRQCSVPHPTQESQAQTVQCHTSIPGLLSPDNAECCIHPETASTVNAVSHICPRMAKHRRYSVLHPSRDSQAQTMQCHASVPAWQCPTSVPGSACIRPRTAEHRQCSVPHSAQYQATNFFPSYSRGQKGNQLFMVEHARFNLGKRLPQNLARVEGRLSH